PLVEERPSFAAVGGGCRCCNDVVGFAIIAAGDHAVMLIAEGNRENTRGFGPSNDRRFAYLPVLTSILGMKDPRGFGRARREPDVVLVTGDQAGAAGREGPFTRQGWWEGLCRKRFPIGSAVFGYNQLKHPFDRIAEGNAVLLVPERDSIEKGCGVGTLELHHPRLAVVGRFVNAGGVARAGAE